MERDADYIDPPAEFWNPDQNERDGWPRHTCWVNGYVMPRFRNTEEGRNLRAEWLNIKTKYAIGKKRENDFSPQTGAVYRHYKGGLYQVLMVVRREGDAELMVVYQPQDGTIPWVRPLTEFGEKFSYVSNVGWDAS